MPAAVATGPTFAPAAAASLSCAVAARMDESRTLHHLRPTTARQRPPMPWAGANMAKSPSHPRPVDIGMLVACRTGTMAWTGTHMAGSPLHPRPVGIGMWIACRTGTDGVAGGHMAGAPCHLKPVGIGMLVACRTMRVRTPINSTAPRRAAEWQPL
eukprot:365365-Chlamydomonas_euryale.AAC.8